MDEDIKNELKQLHQKIGDLASATAKGFERVERAIESMDARLKTVEAGNRSIQIDLEQLPDKIDQTYGGMLNDHEDRIKTLEVA